MMLRILGLVAFVVGMLLLWMPMIDYRQHPTFYKADAQGHWDEPPDAYVCNTHAANVTGTAQNQQCTALTLTGVGLLFPGVFFGVFGKRRLGD